MNAPKKPKKKTGWWGRQDTKQARIDELEEKIQQQVKDFEGLYFAEQSQWEIERDSLLEQIHIIQEQYHTEQNKLTQQHQTLRETLQQSEQEHAAALENREQLHTENAQLQTKQKELQQNLESLQKKLANALQANTAKDAQIETLQTALEVSKRQAEKAKADLNRQAQPSSHSSPSIEKTTPRLWEFATSALFQTCGTAASHALYESYQALQKEWMDQHCPPWNGLKEQLAHLQNCIHTYLGSFQSSWQVDGDQVTIQIHSDGSLSLPSRNGQLPPALSLFAFFLQGFLSRDPTRDFTLQEHTFASSKGIETFRFRPLNAQTSSNSDEKP